VLLIKTSDHNLGDDPGPRLVLSATIITAEKIVFVDRLCASQPISSNCKLDSLKDGRLPGIVVTEKHSRAVKVQVGKSYATKILYVDANDTHKAPRIPTVSTPTLK
jgi:hypothetical protein